MTTVALLSNLSRYLLISLKAELESPFSLILAKFLGSRQARSEPGRKPLMSRLLSVTVCTMTLCTLTLTSASGDANCSSSASSPGILFYFLTLFSERADQSRPFHAAFHWQISQYRSCSLNSLAVFLRLFSVPSDVELLEYQLPLSVSILEDEMCAQKCEERLEQ